MNTNLKKVEEHFGKTFDEIFEENRKYVNMTLSRHYSCYKESIWWEDIQQCALIGLYNAIKTLDINRVKSFRNHIITSIRKEVLYFENAMFGSKGFSKRAANNAGIESLNKSVSEEHEEERINCLSDLDHEEYSISLTENKIINNLDLYNAVDKLNENEKYIINGILENKTQRVIAKELNICESALSVKLKKIYLKLQNSIIIQE